MERDDIKGVVSSVQRVHEELVLSVKHGGRVELQLKQPGQQT